MADKKPCRICGKLTGLKADGTVFRHGRNGKLCEGSHKPPYWVRPASDKHPTAVTDTRSSE